MSEQAVDRQSILDSRGNGDPWLSDAQLERLTRRKRADAQMAVLTEAGIPFKVVAGRAVVLESALNPVKKSNERPQVRKLG